MNQSAFEAADPIVDDIANIIDRAFESSPLDEVKAALTKLNTAIGDGHSVELSLRVEVFCQERTATLPLLITGLASSDDGEPYRTWADSTPHRYVADGDIQIVPHDHCPKCWGIWDFKLGSRTCPSCSATLGDDVKLLLDSDICPNCEQGTISVAQPICEKCGHEIDLDIVTWG